MNLLQVLSNQIVYRAVPAEPLFGLLKDQDNAVRMVYDEFKALNVKIADLRYDNAASIAERSAGVAFGIGYCKVMVERVEGSFSEFHQRQIAEIGNAFGAILGAARRIGQGIPFQSHQLVYYGHAKIQNGTYTEFSKRFAIPTIKSAGEMLNTGVTYTFREPQKGWKLHLGLDASLAFPEAMFLTWTLDILGDELSFDKIRQELQEYLFALLNEFDIQFSEDQNANA